MSPLPEAADAHPASSGAPETGLTVLACTQRQCVLLSDEIAGLQVSRASVDQCFLEFNVDR